MHYLNLSYFRLSKSTGKITPETHLIIEICLISARIMIIVLIMYLLFHR